MSGTARVWQLLAAALGLGVLFGVIPLYSPLMLTYFSGADTSYFVGFLVSASVYYTLTRARRPMAEPPTETQVAAAT